MNVICEAEKYRGKAETLAERLEGRLIDATGNSSEKAPGAGHCSEPVPKAAGSLRDADGDCCDSNGILRYTEGGLSLELGGQSLQGDFTSMLPRLRQDRLRGETLVKAAKFKGMEIQGLRQSAPHTEKPLFAVDGTAGMGEDSLLLAAAGFRVLLCEYNPVIAALLQDALDRAREIPELADIALRMELVEGDSREILRGLSEEPDLVLLDPMFVRHHKGGLSKKKLQVLQQLENPCGEQDGEELLAAAMEAHPRKIVVKRPLRGEYLAGRKPGYSISGKIIRYDCYALNLDGN